MRERSLFEVREIQPTLNGGRFREGAPSILLEVLDLSGQILRGVAGNRDEFHDLRGVVSYSASPS